MDVELNVSQCTQVSLAVASPRQGTSATPAISTSKSSGIAIAIGSNARATVDSTSTSITPVYQVASTVTESLSEKLPREADEAMKTLRVSQGITRYSTSLQIIPYDT